MVIRAKKEAIEDALAYMRQDKLGKVGFFASARYEDGTPVAEVAAKNEFGFGIPLRSFMRTTIAEEKSNWVEIIRKGTKAALNGKAKMSDVMESVAARAAGDMRTKIADIHEPVLDASTILARQERGNSSTKPLVDTRVMLPSLVHLVE